MRTAPPGWADRVVVLVAVAATGLSFGRVFPAAALLVVVGAATLGPAVLLLGAEKAPGRFGPGLLRGLVAAISLVLLFLLLRGALVDLLAMTVPVPATAGLLVVPAAGVWSAAALGLEIAAHGTRPGRLLPLLPVAPVWVYTAMFATDGAFEVRPAGVVAMCVAVQLIRSVRASPAASSALVAVAAVVAVAVPWLVPAGTTHRVDPRRAVPSVVLDGVAVNPIDWVDVWLTRPATPLFTAETGAPVPYWRLAVLTEYDGQRWLPPARYARAGIGVPPARDPAPAVRQTITVQDLPGPFLPAMDRPVRIGAPVVGVDPDSGTLVAGGPLRSGMRYTLSSLAEPAPGPVRCATAVASPVPAELAGPLHELIGNGCDSGFDEFSRSLQSRLNDGRRNVAGVPATGTSVGALRDFLTAGRRGTVVEFATVYTLALRAAGIPSRLVVGFRGGGDGQVVGADVRLWAEALLPGRGWTGVYPVFPPAEPGADAPPVMVPTVPPAPTIPPPTGESPVVESGAGSDTGTGTGWSPARPALVVGGGVVLGYLALVVLVPVVRRRRRRRRGDLREQGAAAWYDVLDELAFTVPVARLRAATPASTGRLIRGGGDLVRVAEISLFAAEPPSADDVRTAWAAAAGSRRGLRRTAGWPRRLARAVSWRNLRLRSPWW